jgi:hypothetical protein
MQICGYGSGSSIENAAAPYGTKHKHLTDKMLLLVNENGVWCASSIPVAVGLLMPAEGEELVGLQRWFIIALCCRSGQLNKKPLRSY